MSKHLLKSVTRRFFLRHTHLPKDLSPLDTYLLDQQEADILFQLNKVFRTTPGQKIILINLPIASTSINYAHLFETVEVTKSQIKLKLIEKTLLHNPLKHHLALNLCFPNKPAKLDFILEKATELGVSQINLIKSDFSQFSHEVRTDRLEKILLEASEQSERPTVPQLRIYDSLTQFLDSKPINCLVALERTSAEQSLLTLSIENVTGILIGPEGGFSEKEISLFDQSKLTITNLGSTILKMDTAALLAIGILSIKLQQ